MLGSTRRGCEMLIRTTVILMIVIMLSGCAENPTSRDERTPPSVVEDFQALEQKIADCMKLQGFEYVPTDLDQKPLTSGVNLLRNSPKEDSMSHAELVAYESALLGNGSAPGCIQSVTSSEQPDPQKIRNYTQKLERTKAKPAVVEAEIEWSRCMSAQGVEVVSPDERKRLVREAVLYSDEGLEAPEISAMEHAALQCDSDYYDVFWQAFEEIELP